MRRAAQTIVIATTAGSGEFDGSISFALNDVFTASDFTGLFDHYRINCVVCKFVLDFAQIVTSNTDPSANNLFVPQFHYAIDNNDNNTATVAALVDYEGYHSTRFTRPISVKIYPKPSVALYNNPTTTGYGTPKGKQWVDIGSPNIPHYGIKYCIDNYYTSQIVRFKVRRTYYFSVKSMK